MNLDVFCVCFIYNDVHFVQKVMLCSCVMRNIGIKKSPQWCGLCLYEGVLRSVVWQIGQFLHFVFAGSHTGFSFKKGRKIVLGGKIHDF